MLVFLTAFNVNTSDVQSKFLVKNDMTNVTDITKISLFCLLWKENIILL